MTTSIGRGSRALPRISSLLYVLIAVLVVSTVAGLFILHPWAQNPETIRVGLLKITPSLRYWVAQDKGFFADRGLKVEFVEDYFSTNQLADDLATGKLDVGHFALSTVFQVWNLKPRQMSVFTLDLNTPANHIDNLYVRSDSTITRVQDLAGKPIGKFPGEQATLVLRSFLIANGLKPEDIVLIDVPPQNQISALMSNQVAALDAYEPIGSLLELDYHPRVLVNGVTINLLNPFPGGAGAFSSKFLDARPDDAQKFVSAINDATDYVNDPKNKVEVYSILAKHLGIRIDVAARTHWLEWVAADKADLENLNAYVILQVAQGQLPKLLDVKEMIYHAK